MINLQTAKRRDIPNGQDSEISAFERNWSAEIPLLHPEARLRTGLSPAYNCFGLAFASRRTKITSVEYITPILEDDSYKSVDRHDCLPGDLILYFDDQGSVTHAGLVVENAGPLFVPVVCSKWGGGPEVIHRYYDVPSVYGSNHLFYRCRL
jgi:hypothetical protein